MSVLLITILCLIFLNFNIVDINIFMSYVLLFFCVFLARPLVVLIDNFLQLNPLIFLIIAFITGIYALIK